MKKKEIKWGNKELPGLTEDQLFELDSATLARLENLEIAKKASAEKGYDNWFNAAKKWREENPEAFKATHIAGGKVQGKIQGAKNVESGHWDKCRKLAKKSITKKAKNRNQIHIEAILNIMQQDVWYSAQELLDFGVFDFCDSVYAHKNTRRFLQRNQDYFEVKSEGKGHSKTKYYKKKGDQ